MVFILVPVGEGRSARSRDWRQDAAIAGRLEACRYEAGSRLYDLHLPSSRWRGGFEEDEDDDEEEDGWRCAVSNRHDAAQFSFGEAGEVLQLFHFQQEGDGEETGHGKLLLRSFSSAVLDSPFPTPGSTEKVQSVF